MSHNNFSYKKLPYSLPGNCSFYAAERIPDANHCHTQCHTQKPELSQVSRSLALRLLQFSAVTSSVSCSARLTQARSQLASFS